MMDGGSYLHERVWYVHKHEVSLASGGPEEGGWWFTVGTPVEDWTPLAFTDEEEFYAKCRELNEQEHERRDREEDYDFSSVLSYRSTHYEYGHTEEYPEARAFPEFRPHYE